MRQASKRIPESAEKTVRDIRRATRRHHSAEEKIRIVLEGLRGEDSIAELCRKEGINQNLYYRWSKEFLEAMMTRSHFRNGGTSVASTLPACVQFERRWASSVLVLSRAAFVLSPATRWAISSMRASSCSSFCDSRHARIMPKPLQMRAPTRLSSVPSAIARIVFARPFVT